MELTFSSTAARPILIKRARATSLPADAREKPGCDAVAARLPNDPGVQKLSPTSSADASCGASASAVATVPPARRRDQRPCRTPDPFVPISPPNALAAVARSTDTCALQLYGEPCALVSRFRSSHHCAAASFANFGIEGH